MTRSPIDSFAKGEKLLRGLWLRQQLDGHAWSLTASAKAIGSTIPRLRRLIAADKTLAKLYAKNNPGRGRPRKVKR